MTLAFLPCHFKNSTDPVKSLAERVSRETGAKAEEAEVILRRSGIDCATANQTRVISLFRIAMDVKRRGGEQRLER